jgi:hypothetical protein
MLYPGVVRSLRKTFDIPDGIARGSVEIREIEDPLLHLSSLRGPGVTSTPLHNAVAARSPGLVSEGSCENRGGP